MITIWHSPIELPMRKGPPAVKLELPAGSRILDVHENVMGSVVVASLVARTNQQVERYLVLALEGRDAEHVAGLPYIGVLLLRDLRLHFFDAGDSLEARARWNVSFNTMLASGGGLLGLRIAR